MRAHIASILLSAAVVFVACYDQPLVPGDEQDERITVTNDEIVLEQRVEYREDLVAIDPDGTAPAAGGPARSAGPMLAPSVVTLTLLAEAESPTVDGESVQATSVWLRDDGKAIVAYAYAGGPVLGALDYFIQLTKKKPILMSSATFSDTEVNGISMDGNWAYAATLSSDTSLPSSAVVERLQFLGNKFTLEGNLRAPLSSFAATSTLSVGTTVYATSGDAGAVFALSADDLSVLAEYPLDDARWVAWDEAGGRIAVAQGTPGRIALFDEASFSGGSPTLLGTIEFPGADVAESKSTVEVHGGKAFIAAGPDGVQVVCLDNGAVVGSVPRPDPATLGLDPSVVVTNAVTVQGDLMFISNGEAGVYAAAGAESFESSACDAPQQITVLGKLRFDALQSANHVVYRSGYLYVAAGRGGIKIVEVEVDP